ncbi:hypothetical protein LCGC14_0267410 [marine sediment metagenome]|uniref:Uncharacterized protein n=1 Tax=marine sediment metagenome TaxID=412755 RepID=A0A0F9TZX9_9ZZZZ
MSGANCGLCGWDDKRIERELAETEMMNNG